SFTRLGDTWGLSRELGRGARITSPSGAFSATSRKLWSVALGAVTIEKTHHTSWNENAGLQDRGVRILAVVAFLGGLLLAVRTMFFGVQRRLDENHLAHRVWPLGLGAFLVISGALVYVRATA